MVYRILIIVFQLCAMLISAKFTKFQLLFRCYQYIHIIQHMVTILFAKVRISTQCFVILFALCCFIIIQFYTSRFQQFQRCAKVVIFCKLFHIQMDQIIRWLSDCTKQQNQYLIVEQILQCNMISFFSKIWQVVRQCLEIIEIVVNKLILKSTYRNFQEIIGINIDKLILKSRKKNNAFPITLMYILSRIYHNNIQQQNQVISLNWNLQMKYFTRKIRFLVGALNTLAWDNRIGFKLYICWFELFKQ
eukprot:TRINITY_DN15_c0_g1_i2.p2 TRINITY_DN15_c0_g1~~TRINITY_DN15_c0_g1_i2.p2  ORF type:complete len:247 (-),score=-21.82 TRINITY_DN15_c0_g1_i2:309-1049(-)